jgi:hypothetical protein
VKNQTAIQILLLKRRNQKRSLKRNTKRNVQVVRNQVVKRLDQAKRRKKKFLKSKRQNLNDRKIYQIVRVIVVRK